MCSTCDRLRAEADHYRRLEELVTDDRARLVLSGLISEREEAMIALHRLKPRA